MTFRAKITALLIAFATVLGLAIASPASATVVANSRTTCAGTEAFGPRVCIDLDTAYGPQVYVYADPTRPWYYTARSKIQGGGLVANFDATGSDVNDTGFLSSYVYITNVPSPSLVSTVYFTRNSPNSYDAFAIDPDPAAYFNGSPAPYDVNNIYGQIESVVINGGAFIVAN